MEKMKAVHIFIYAAHVAGFCNLTGYWTYLPEPGHNYQWQEDANGVLGCFHGTGS